MISKHHYIITNGKDFVVEYRIKATALRYIKQLEKSRMEKLKIEIVWE